MWYVVVFSSLAALTSLVGGVILTLPKNYKKIAKYAAAFAAGALLAAVGLDLLPHIGHDNGHLPYFLMVGGVLIFFFLELILNHAGKKKHVAALVVISDTVHNVVDGIVIAAGFLVSVPSGIAVTLAVMAHEIPQEIGDFGLMMHHGMSRKRTIIINIASALATIMAAIVFFAIGSQGELETTYMMGLASGFFLYLALHAMQEIYHSGNKKTIWIKAGFLLLGLVMVGLAIELLKYGH
ncbi:ZIP family metal transporter [Candidatus Saccharibacteria bacterium]|nr:ZIP family metal transporter [Candidatus Saccharibacteria bacterium]